MSINRRFEWDTTKASANVRAHGVTFETATRAFLDPFAILEQDRIERGEQRWQTIGMADGVTLLLVAHVFRDDGNVEVVRIISGRRAVRQESRRYEGENRSI